MSSLMLLYRSSGLLPRRCLLVRSLMSTLVARDLHFHFHPRLLHCSLDLLLRRHLPLRDRGALRPPERYGFIVANLVDPTT